MIYAHVSILHTLKITKVYREEAATSVLMYWEGPQRFWKFSMGSEYAPQDKVNEHIQYAFRQQQLGNLKITTKPASQQWKWNHRS